MPNTALFLWKEDEDSYVLEMASDIGSLSIQVAVPKESSERLYAESEREELALGAAQRVAAEFLTKTISDLDKRRH